MIVIDVETTGIDYTANSLVSIGAIDFNNPSDQFYIECRVWEGAIVTDQALAINGFTHEQVVDSSKKSEAEAIELFLEWLKGKSDLTVAGQNVYFDLYFLEAAATRAGIKLPLGKRIVDIHSLCFAHMLQKGESVPLIKEKSAVDSDFIMNYVGLPPEPKPHIALNGAKYEAEALHRFIFKKSLFEEFKQYNISDKL